MNRKDVSFQSGNDTCAAWLYPAAKTGPDGRSPMIVMAHGFTGTRRDGLGGFAERFAAEGIAALVFDYRGFGDSTGPRSIFELKAQIDDWAAAIAFARRQSGVDPERIATFGSSMGGGHAMAAAANDPRIAAVVSQVPFLHMIKQSRWYGFRVGGKLLGIALLDRIGALIGREPRFVPAVGEPNEAAFINAAGAAAGWRHVVETGEDSRWENRVAARMLIGPLHRPGARARKLHCPWLLCIADNDRTARPGPALAAAKRAARAEVRRYPGVDHFDIYDGPAFEAVVADEIEFLRRHLLALS